MKQKPGRVYMSETLYAFLPHLVPFNRIPELSITPATVWEQLCWPLLSAGEYLWRCSLEEKTEKEERVWKTGLPQFRLFILISLFLPPAGLWACVCPEGMTVETDSAHTTENSCILLQCSEGFWLSFDWKTHKLYPKLNRMLAKQILLQVGFGQKILSSCLLQCGEETGDWAHSHEGTQHSLMELDMFVSNAK